VGGRVRPGPGEFVEDWGNSLMPLTAIEAASRTPVTLLTGFLGSGKTTVLNHVLKQPEMAATAVIVNEFGEIGIDHLLVEMATDDVVLMQSGCLCCTIRGDIADTLVNLFVDRAKGRIPGFERVVIETTGLADPAPILHALMSDPIVAERYMVDGVVTTVDAVNGADTLDRQAEAVKQAAVADRLLLTKCDLASAEARRALEARLAALNPGAPIIEVNGGAVDPKFLFNLGLFDPNTKTIEVRRWLGEEMFADEHEHGHHHHGHDVNRHDAHISSFCIIRDQPVSWTALSGWLDALSSMRGADLLRVKAIVAIDERPGQPVVLHGVQHLFHPPVLLPEWPSEDHRTRIVFITRDLSRETIEESLAAYVDADAPPNLAPPPATYRHPGS
jgi:G3E family GTPase